MSNSTKQMLRNVYKDIRLNLSVDYLAQASTTICQHIIDMQTFQDAHHIALYHAFNHEVDLTLVWQTATQQGKRCYFPMLNQDKTLTFLPATPNTPMKPNPFGIPEPQVKKQDAININMLDIACIPLLAFDRQGTRLGMGGGYYDRTFAKNKPRLRLGVAFECQKAPSIPIDPWDVPLPIIITDKKTYRR